jgi:hypothetical protein
MPNHHEGMTEFRLPASAIGRTLITAWNGIEPAHADGA